MRKSMRKAKWTTIYIHEAHLLGKWLHQNAAECTGDFVEGVLLDNFVVWTKNGVAAIYEQYVNSSKSEYRVEFQRGDGDIVWRRWEQFAAKAESA